MSDTDRVQQAIDMLAADPDTATIASMLRTIPISFPADYNDRSSVARYNPNRKVIEMRPDQSRESVANIAAVLAHEGQHALDDSHGMLGSDPKGYLQAEITAAHVESGFWEHQYGADGIQPAKSKSDREENLHLQAMHAGWMDEAVIDTYLPRLIGESR